MAQMKNAAPAQKVTATTLAAAVVTLAFGFMPEGLSNVVQFKAEIIVVVTFIAGYYMPPAKRDAVE